MSDLKLQLEDPQKRTEILEKLARFVGHKVIRTREEWGHVCTVKQPGGCTDFDPFATTPQGAWNFEQVLSAIEKKGWDWTIEKEDELYQGFIFPGLEGEKPSFLQCEGPTHRYAVCAAVLEMLEGEG